MISKPHNVPSFSGIDDFFTVQCHGVVMLQVYLIVFFLSLFELSLVQDFPNILTNELTTVKCC